MKILMTGCTGNQCKVRRDKNPLYSNALGVLIALENLGHDVDNRLPLREDERIDDYDELVMGLYNPAGLAAGQAPQAMMTAFKAFEAGVKVRFFVDDWAVDSIGAGLRGESRRSETSLTSHIKFVVGDGEQSWIANEAVKVAATYRVVGNMKNYKVICPLFAWVKENRLAEASGWPSQNIRTLDPTPLFPVIEVEPQPKVRQWVLSSRHDFSSFIDEIRSKGSQWPVIRYGHKKSGDNIVKNELDLLDAAYAPNWGILSHPYKPELQGQWRNRYLFATWTNSIIYGVGNEVKDLPSYFNLPIGVIERMSDTELEVLALEQRVTHNQMCGTLDKAMDTVHEWLS